MGERSPKFDAYIGKSPDFARPILKHLRELVHKHCPDCIEEMKWSHPHFSYKGMFCGMAAFKQHASFGFWHSLLRDQQETDAAFGSFGKLTSLRDLPPNARLVKLLKEAMRLNDEG